MADNLTLEQYNQATGIHKKPLENLQAFHPEVWQELLDGRAKGIPIKRMVMWLKAMKNVKVSESGLFYAFKKWDDDWELRMNHAEVQYANNLRKFTAGNE